MSFIPLLAMLISSGLPNTRLVAIEPNLEFPPQGSEAVKVMPRIEAGIPFREMIASWNVEPAGCASLKDDSSVTVQLLRPGSVAWESVESRWRVPEPLPCSLISRQSHVSNCLAKRRWSSGAIMEPRR